MLGVLTEPDLMVATAEIKPDKKTRFVNPHNDSGYDEYSGYEGICDIRNIYGVWGYEYLGYEGMHIHDTMV